MPLAIFVASTMIKHMNRTAAREKLIARVNRKLWWRTCLPDEKAIRDRGLFFASSFEEAEFYGRPLDTPFRVKIKSPIVGSFVYIQKRLLGKNFTYDDTVKAIFAHDKLLKRCAQLFGFDSIIVLSAHGHKKFYSEKRLPKSVELNVFDPGAIHKIELRA